MEGALRRAAGHHRCLPGRHLPRRPSDRVPGRRWAPQGTLGHGATGAQQHLAGAPSAHDPIPFQPSDPLPAAGVSRRAISGRRHQAPVFSFVLVCLLLYALGGRAGVAAAADSPDALSIRIAGNHFVDGGGRPVRMLGVNRSGTEYECMDGRGFFDGPSDAASIAVMASWHINTVRVPLNEDCWLGINGAPAAFSGAAYRDAIVAYVRRLHDAGLYAIVDLHWSAQGTLPADGKTGQGRKMADRDHAPAFWRSVGSTFRRDPAVVFDLFNEPHDISWDCWQNGCTTQDATGSWQVAGYQSLVDAVRASGAPNPVLVAGNRWAT